MVRNWSLPLPSRLLLCSKKLNGAGDIAQLVEDLPRMHEVLCP